MPRYLVTGGAGFIGSHLVEALLQRSHPVRVLDNLSTGSKNNLAPFLSHIEFIEGDVRDFTTVERAMRDVHFVLHQAALPSVPRSVQDPLASNAANVDGTLNVLWAAKQAGVQRVIYASSSSVYGNVATSPKHEDLTPAPASPYAVSKLAGEYYCRVFYHVYGLETVALRYFNVFGPRQDPHSPYAAVIPRFISRLRQGLPPIIYGDGTQTRDFTFVANVVHANLLACTAPSAAGSVINIACGDSVTLLHLAAELNRLMSTNLAPIHAPPRPGDVLHSRADIRRAQILLGYEPVCSFSEGLARTVASFVQSS
ncbi:MAG: SDR family oxidoreductase [bacterium]|nr:SDR family oxidoreductase [bacterium]